MSPAKKRKSVPAADLREEYGAPFSIVSREEGSRYKALLSRDFNSPRCLNFRLIERLGWTSVVDSYCRNLSLETFVKMKHHGYQQLMLEFYTTLSFDEDDDDDRFHCRLMGKNVTVTRKTLCDIFGFRKGGHKTVPQDFDPVGFWREISGTGRCGDFKIGDLSINRAKDPILLHMYKFISHGVFGKSDSSSVVVKDLFYLFCGYRDVRVCTASFLIATFKSVIRNKKANMCLGNFITAIAVYFGMIDPLDTDMTVLPMLPLRMLKKHQCIKEATEETSSSSDLANGEGTNPMAIDDHPTGLSDTLMLISRKLEKMQKRMDSGFNAIETRFDGLEKKVNVMRARSKKRKWMDSRQLESNGTNTVEELKMENFEAKKFIDKLRMEKSESDKATAIYKTRLAKLLPSIKKIAEGLSKMSSMKVVDLASLVNDMREFGTFEEGDDSGFPDSRGKTGSLRNGSMPVVDAEDVAVLLPGDRSTSNTIGSRGKGLSKNGDRNSPQPRTREDDITHTVKNSSDSQSGHSPPPPGFGYLDSRGKKDNLGNRSMPDVNTEDVAVLLPGVHWTSNSNRSRSKRLPKNGYGRYVQTWAIEDDNAHNVKNSPGSQSDHSPLEPGSNECVEPLGSVVHASGTRVISGEKIFCKTTSSPLAAAGDIIVEVHDSDDETKPNRVAQTSKRVQSPDEMNSVHISKRNRSDMMGSLFALSNTERKKDVRTVENNVLIHEKGNEVLKSRHDNVGFSASGRCVEEAVESQNSLNDESFADSEDEALSDSGMEDLIASLRSSG